MSDNESPNQTESRVDFEAENEFVSQKMLMSQKFKEYEELKTEYEAYIFDIFIKTAKNSIFK